MFEYKLRDNIFYKKGYIEKLIKENYDDIYRYCYCHLNNVGIAQDMTQETFLKFLNNIDRYQEYGKLKNYLYVIAGNTIRDYLRRPQELYDMELERTPLQSSEVELLADKITVLDAVHSLESLEREIIILRYYQDLRIKDIADILDKPASTVRYTLKKAEKHLKKKLEDIRE